MNDFPGKYSIGELKIICPKCDQHLVLEKPELFTELTCPGCEYDLSEQLPGKKQNEAPIGSPQLDENQAQKNVPKTRNNDQSQLLE